ncbi:unnamed protein product [Ectocarpus sp. CCAP 1310/34]|nr:unnamed protein product [Ectocarpus sp. CCAP 1310/34]
MLRGNHFFLLAAATVVCRPASQLQQSKTQTTARDFEVIRGSFSGPIYYRCSSASAHLRS